MTVPIKIYDESEYTVRLSDEARVVIYLETRIHIHRACPNSDSGLFRKEIIETLGKFYGKPLSPSAISEVDQLMLSA